MRIAEIFHSIQGEGRLAGIPSAFIRTSGCNLRCHWCDTPYTSWQPEGEEWPVSRVLERVGQFPARHAVVTGGEPLLAPDLGELGDGLRERGYHITIETAATVFKPVACDLASLSPKLANSTPHQREGGRHALHHEQARLRPDVIAAWMAQGDYQLKFVIERPGDLTEVRDLLVHLPDVDPGKVLLMPQGIEREQLQERGRWLAEVCKQSGFRYCPRLHIELYGHVRGT
jgi:7-carboxy-7-deazaguanine synthase